MFIFGIDFRRTQASVLLIIFTSLSFNIHAEVLSKFERCFRFNINHLTNSLPVPSSVNFGESSWVSTLREPESGIVHFIARPSINNLGTPDDVFFTDTWPTYYPIYDPETGSIKYEMEVNIVCQWDVADGTSIFSDQTITNRLLNTPVFTSNESPEDDRDVFRFHTTKECYCIEVPTNNEVQLGISLNGFEFDTAFFESTTDVFHKTVGPVKRFYKNDWIKETNYYIKIFGDIYDNNFYYEPHNYIFTIKNIKPIVLVHGINSHPINPTDHESAFSEIKIDFPYFFDLKPNVFFDYPWNQKYGKYTLYSGSGNNSLYMFTYMTNSKSIYQPLVISHSMGGLLTIRQIRDVDDFSDLVDSFVFFGSPFCGADSATLYEIAYFTNTSQTNINCLKRGTNNIWDFMQNIPYGALLEHNPLFFIGTNSIMKLWKIKKSGGKDCDGIVPISSANLPETLNRQGEYLEVNYNHTEMKEIKYPYNDDDALKIFNKLKEHINN